MTLLRRGLLGSALAIPAARAAWGSVVAQATQAPAFFRYPVGSLQITAINDGYGYRALDGFIPNAPVAEVKQALADAFLPTDRFPITYNSLAINTGSKLVLIDTGNGDLGGPSAGTWMANFRAAGFDPAQVDTVILSHFHGDHINGLRLKDGTAVFPKAEIMVPEPEWAFWTSDTERARTPNQQPNFTNVQRVFGPMMKDVTTYRWDQEIVPGVTAVRADGHTPGHTALAIVSGPDRLLMLSDVTNNTTIFARHPDWSPIFDQDFDTARKTRHRMLDMVVSERMRVAFYHAPFPATGHVVRDGDGYALVPALWTPQG